MTKFFEFSTFIYSFFTFDETNNFFIAAWSLAVEEWFYFIFPIFGMLMIRLNFSKGKLLTIFIITFVLVKIYYEIFYDINFHRITVFRLDSIAIGYVAYLITKDYEKISKTLLSTLFLLALFLFVLSYVLFLNKHVLYTFCTILFLYNYCFYKIIMYIFCTKQIFNCNRNTGQ